MGTNGEHRDRGERPAFARRVLLAQVFGLLCMKGNAAVSMSFTALSQATEMLDAHLATRDRAGLLASCAQAGHCVYLQRNPQVFDLLVYERSRAGSLRQLYEAVEFPPEGSTFKLGGHRKELGHVHIDFVKVGERWVLHEIWNCR